MNIQNLPHQFDQKVQFLSKNQARYDLHIKEIEIELFTLQLLEDSNMEAYDIRQQFKNLISNYKLFNHK